MRTEAFKKLNDKEKYILNVPLKNFLMKKIYKVLQIAKQVFTSLKMFLNDF
jgi:hypothetical protein